MRILLLIAVGLCFSGCSSDGDLNRGYVISKSTVDNEENLSQPEEVAP